jgi:D-psicose/D-tagatose/L-ribulose 3-epimerase
MRYGFCTNLASPLTDAVEYGLVADIGKAGYDYVEFPLTLLDRLSDRQFDRLLGDLDRLRLGCDSCCNMFPEHIRIVGPGAPPAFIDPYLQRTFSRAARIGTRKVVLGSAFSRNLPEGFDAERGYGQLTDLIVNRILPLCVKYGIHVVIEPIRRAACNFINTLAEGKALVDRVASPHVTLMADTIHMLNAGENGAQIRQYFPVLDHVHVTEMDRVLPEEGFSIGVKNILVRLKEMGYDKTISFETRPGNVEKALLLLKSTFA